MNYLLNNAHANAYAATHAIQIQIQSKTKDGDERIEFETAPISLLPNAFPRYCFERAQQLAPTFNELIDIMSRDVEFISSILQQVGEVDPFTGKLLKMYQELYDTTTTNESGKFARDADRLGILRSDYMLNSNTDKNDSDSDDDNDDSDDKYKIQQIELNTIASSFAGLATNVAGMHNYLVQRFGQDPSSELHQFLSSNVQAITGNRNTNTNTNINTNDNTNDNDDERNGVPHNPALDNLPKAMQLAHERYSSHYKPEQPTMIVFVVQPNETNTIDQRLLEFKLWNTYQTPVIRLSLQDIPTKTTYNEQTGALTLNDTGHEISVVYFRAGYAPTDYPTENCWEGRQILEQSRATKCPNLGYHLCGTKKMQQHLSRPNVVEQFLSKDNSQNIRQAFAGLYSLSASDMEPEDYQALEQILMEQKQEQYVLKPQREGGGYNYYGNDLDTKLRENIDIDINSENENENEHKMTLSKELAEFILMERIFPPHQQAILLRSGKIEGQGESISEFGCFGCIISSAEGDILHNEYAGFLLRTKFVGVNEGGVASGFATLSSPYLC